MKKILLYLLIIFPILFSSCSITDSQDKSSQSSQNVVSNQSSSSQVVSSQTSSNTPNSSQKQNSSNNEASTTQSSQDPSTPSSEVTSTESNNDYMNWTINDWLKATNEQKEKCLEIFNQMVGTNLDMSNLAKIFSTNTEKNFGKIIEIQKQERTLQNQQEQPDPGHGAAAGE